MDSALIKLLLSAEVCKSRFFTDVEGVYPADPRKIKGAQKLNEITYDEMLELATLGAQVLNNRSVEMAKKYNVKLEVLSSLVRKPGTIVKEVADMEKMLVRGVTKDTDVARVSIIGVPNVPGIAYKIFGKLAAKDVNVDIILQSVGRGDTKDITFTTTKAHMNDTVETLKALDLLEGLEVICDTNVAKVSVVGAGMETHPGVASKMFESLSDAGINIQNISTSEIKISVLVDIKDGERALNAVHDAFIN